MPDLLGYAGTDKPTNVEAYSLKEMSQDIVDIINSLEWARNARVIVISHDWYVQSACIDAQRRQLDVHIDSV